MKRDTFPIVKVLFRCINNIYIERDVLNVTDEKVCYVCILTVVYSITCPKLMTVTSYSQIV